jgi:hypothetical protein
VQLAGPAHHLVDLGLSTSAMFFIQQYPLWRAERMTAPRLDFGPRRHDPTGDGTRRASGTQASLTCSTGRSTICLATLRSRHPDPSPKKEEIGQRFVVQDLAAGAVKG